MDGSVTPAIVDVILQSKAAMTLSVLCIFDVGIRYSFLRLPVSCGSSLLALWVGMRHDGSIPRRR